MNPAEIKQVLETIKTLNLNINDETTQKLVGELAPIARMYLMREYVEIAAWLIFGLSIIGLFVYLIKKDYNR